MHIEYKIKYKIDGDIPINPSWIRAQLQAGVDKLQAEINKKNLAGKHTVELNDPGWKLQASSSKLQAPSSKRHEKNTIK